MTKPIRTVMLTNDDGLDAPGLKILEAIASEIAEEIWVVAPVMDASGTGSSVSIHDALRVYSPSPRRFGVSGTPSDCVMVGVKALMAERGLPDLVLSGVNRGANLATDSHYSGTLGAAGTARLLGIPAIALSQGYLRDDTEQVHVHWETAEKYGPQIVRDLVTSDDWPVDFVPNINFPPVPPEAVTGTEITVQGEGVLDIEIDRRTDPRNTDYFWLRFRRGMTSQKDNSDISALRRGAISVTPIGFDRTDVKGYQKLTRLLSRG